MGLSESEMHMVRAQADASAAEVFRDQIMQSVKTAQLAYAGSAETARLLHEPEPVISHGQLAIVLDKWIRSAKTAEEATRKRVLKSYGLE